MSSNRFWRDASLPFVEIRHASDSADCFRPHTHPTLSIGAADGGAAVMQSRGEQTALRAGDVVVIPPGVVHSCNPVEGSRWNYRMLFLDAEWVREHIGSNDLCFGERATVIRDGRRYGELCRIDALLRSNAAATEKSQALIRYLVDLSRRDPPLHRRPDFRHPWLPQTKAMLAERCDEPWPLSRIAQETGVSRFRLIRAFQAETGMTPHAWLVDLRVNRAKAWMRAGRALADVAHDLQFSDQSHFQRAFKQRVAVTPRGYCIAG